MFPLVETIKVLNGHIYHLPYHQERFAHACHLYLKARPVDTLAGAIVIPDKFSTGLVKLRFLYGPNTYQLEFSTYTPRRINSLKMIIADDISYPFKWTVRGDIDTLFRQKGTCDDILIIKNGRITDTSIANIVFYDGRDWFTPLHPLLKGTCRERLLAEDRIKTADIRLADLSAFNYFYLINALSNETFSPIPVENIHL